MRARPRRWVIGLAISMAVLLALWLAGCGGGDGGAVAVNPSRDSQPAIDDGGERLLPEADPSQPEQELPPGLVVVGDSLPAFPGSDGDGPYSAYRMTSEAGQRVVDGDQRMAEAGSGNYPAEESDGYVIVPGGDDELSAWVQFSVPEFDAVRPVIIYFEVDAAPLVPGGDDELPLAYWVGVANFTTYRWEWQGPFDEADGFKLNSPMVKDRYVSEDGVQHFVVLTLAGQQYAGEGNPQGLTAARVESTRINTLTVTDAGYFHTNPHYVGIDTIQLGIGSKQAAELDPDRQWVTITWTHHRDYEDPNGEAFMYQVERRDAATGERALLGSKTAPGYGYVDPADNDSPLDEAVPGMTYKYYLRAANPLNGFTPWSLAREVKIPGPLPVADLQADPILGPPPLLVSFDASGSYDDDGEIIRYEFDFGEGGGWEDYYDTAIADHEYTAHGDYTARVRVTDDENQPGEASVEIDVNLPPTAAFTVDPPQGEPDMDFFFEAGDSTDDDGWIVDYDWDYNGDGTWDDGGPLGIHCYEHSGDYHAALRVTDDGGATDIATQLVVVNWPPVAVLEAIPGSGPPPLIVDFDASLSTDEDGEIDRYEWDFNEDEIFSGEPGALAEEDLYLDSDTAEYTYSDLGEYEATVRVTDDDGDSDTYTVDVVVNYSPVAVLSADPLSGGAPLEVGFDASLSTDEDGEIEHYEWDFNGDGIFSGEPDALWEEDMYLDSDTAEYVYGNAGDYTASVRVWDNDGDSDTAEASVAVYPTWTHTWGSSAADEATDGVIVADSGPGSGAGIYLTGMTMNGSEYDVLLLKYNSDGARQWVRAWGAEGDSDVGNGIAHDDDGHIYVCGRTDSSLGAGGQDALLLRYDSSGELSWQKTWGGTGSDVAYDVAVDDDGSIWVVGHTSSFGQGGSDVFVLKYNSSGSLQVQKVWGGIYDDFGYGMFVDGLDNLWIAGQSIRNSADDEALLLLRFKCSTGALLWQKTWGSSADGYETGWAVVSDSSGDAYVCGTSELTGAGGRDCVALKYDASTGALVWAKTWGGSSNDNGHDVCLDEDGNLLLTGNAPQPGMPGAGGGVMLLILDAANGLRLDDWVWSSSGTDVVSGASVVLDPQTGVSCVTGRALRVSGSWDSRDEDSADAGGSSLDITETLQDALGTAKDISGTSSTPSGSDDDDEGIDADALVMMLDLASLIP